MGARGGGGEERKRERGSEKERGGGEREGNKVREREWVCSNCDMVLWAGLWRRRWDRGLSRGGRRRPVAILSATPGQYETARGAAAGMAGLVTRPLGRPVLQQELVRVLKGSLARR